MAAPLQHHVTPPKSKTLTDTATSPHVKRPLWQHCQWIEQRRPSTHILLDWRCRSLTTDCCVQDRWTTYQKFVQPRKTSEEASSTVQQKWLSFVGSMTQDLSGGTEEADTQQNAAVIYDSTLEDTAQNLDVSAVTDLLSWICTDYKVMSKYCPKWHYWQEDVS